MKKPSATKPLNNEVIASSAYTLNPKPLLKIGQAAKALGISIDTLRRWEKSGKIKTEKTGGGTRFYSLSELKRIKPKSVESFETSSLSTEELLKKTAEETLASKGDAFRATPESGFWQDKNDHKIASLSDAPHHEFLFKKALVTKFLIGTATLSAITLTLTSLIAAAYLTQPKPTQQFFKNNVASALLSPFRKLAEESVAVISPKQARELGFIPQVEQPQPRLQGDALEAQVLATTSAARFLEVNADTQVNGSLSVRDQINNITLEGTPSASTITLRSGDATLTVSKDTKLDQDVSTTAAPTFTSLNLSATKNQLVFQSGGPTGTLTFTPTGSAKIITLPDATTTLVGKDTTDTLTNKSMSGSSNTFTNIPNSALVNKKVTVSAGTNLTGGGDVELGSSITISAKSSPSFSGAVLLSDGTAAAPGLAFTDDTDTGLYRIGTNKLGLITGGTATSGITIDASGNVGVGTITPTSAIHVVGTGNITGNVTIGGTLGVTGAGTLSSTLNVSGNSTFGTNSLFVNTTTNQVGIGTTTPGGSLGVLGNVGVGVSFANAASPANGLAVQGNLGVGITTANATLTVNGGATIGTGYNLLAPTNGLLVQGLVGIGTTSPGGTLAVSGNQLLGTFSNLSGPANGLAVSGNVGIGTTTSNSNLSVAGNAHIGSLRQGISAPTDGLFVDGNVGIGATTSSNRLDVWGNERITGNSTIDGALGVSGASTFSSTGTFSSTLTASNGLTLTTGALSLTSTSGSANLGLTSSTQAFRLGAGFDFDSTNSRVGVGSTAAPSSTLAVNGGVNIGSGYYSSAAPSNGLAVQGNIGIGTTSPSQPLHVIGNSQFNGNLLAGTDVTYDIGSAAVRYNNLYVYTLTATNLAGVVTSGSTSSSDWLINSTNTSDSANTTLSFKRGSATNAVLQWYGNNNTFDFNSGIRLGYNNGSASTIESTTGLVLSGFSNDITTGTNEHLALIPNGTGNVGIGTSSPISVLTVQGKGTSTGLNFLTTGSTGVQGLAAMDNGNVGIGTTLPSSLLANTSTNIVDGASTGVATTALSWAVNGAGYTQGLYNASTASNAQGLLVKIAGTSNLNRILTLGTGSSQGSAGTDLFVVTGAGNVGIGNTTPGATLAVTGNSVIGFGGTGGNIAGPSSGLAISGNVGIGATTANSNLSVAGNAHIGGIRQGISAPTNGLFVDGNVGIGATTSSNLLDVWGNARIAGTLTVDSTITGPTTGTVGYFSRTTNPVALVYPTTITDTIGTYGNIGAGTTNPSQVFQVNANASNPVVITSGGNVGIGFTSPTAALTFGGTPTINNTSGNITIQPAAGLALGGGTASVTMNSTVTLQGVYNLIGVNRLSMGGGGVTAANSITGDTASNLNLIALADGTVARSFTLQTQSAVTSGVGNSSTRLTIEGGSATSNAYFQNVNVGIGTTVPNATLSIQGNVGIGYTGASQVIPSNGLAVSGNVGIGITTANSTLSVAGNTHIGSLYQSIAAPTNGLFVDGNVGIGATTSSNRLDVWGNARVTGTLTVDGALTSGSTTLPSLTLTGNNGALSFTGTTPSITSGANSFSIFSGGNVGIGTSSPLYGALTVKGLGTGTGITLQTYGSNLTQGLTVLDNGNVGIGTTNPNFNLQVIATGNFGNIGVGGSLVTSGNVGIGQSLTVTSASALTTLNVTGISNLVGNVGIGTSLNISNLTFAQGGLRVNGFSDLTGNVGIGTSLVVKDGTQLQSSLAVLGNTNLTTLTSTATTHTGTLTFAGVALDMTTGLNENLTIIPNGTGNVGIGYSSPYAKLFVLGQGTGTGINFQTVSSTQVQGLTVLDNGNVGIGNTGPVQTFQINTGSSATVITSSGNLGIGITTANSTLSVSGSAHIGGIRQGIAAPTNGLFVDGNVGIGATTSNNLLDVWGNARITGTLTVDSTGTLGAGLIGYSGVTVPASGLAVSGNVGVGTTSPLQALHVVGQCVTGDTKLKRRKRSKKKGVILGSGATPESDEEGSWTSQDDSWEDVEIKNILPGDEILTLDEKSGEFIPSKVRNLMDMGIQKTYLLITETGKQIRTTANHPYLVREDLMRSSSLSSVAGSNTGIGHSQDNQSYNTHNQINNNERIHNYLFNNRLANQNIPVITNPNITLLGSILSTAGKTTEASITKAISDEISDNLSNLPSENLGKDDIKSNPSTDFKGSQWIKVSQLKTGMEVATFPSSVIARSGNDHDAAISQKDSHGPSGLGMTIQWEKIVSIKEYAREQVWDIEVENTHNFVGNNIVAHNTYINGNLGIGITTPGAGLALSSNAVIGYSGVNIAGPSSGLAVSGNVGIGITTANSTLSVAGSAHIGTIRQGIAAPANGLFVDGNVGIGATTSSNLLDVWGNARITGTLTVDGNFSSGGGVFLASDGSASAPGYSFSADTDTGIFRPGTNALGFSTNGSSRLTITEAGNIGIGITNPIGALQVNGAGAFGYGSIPTSSLPSNGLAVSGNVGIGTTSPNNRLQVIDLINFDNSMSGTFLGYQAGNVTTGSFNTFVGFRAGLNNTTGVNNSAFGYQALFYNTRGINNSAFGYNALLNNTTGSANSAFGQQALTLNTTGSNNSAFGRQALASNTTGSANSAFGQLALNNVGVGTSNAAFGYQAGNSLTSGSTNTLLGAFAGQSLTTGSGNIVIGYNADALSATGSNRLNIGNLLFGTGLDGTATTLSSGNIGIGWTSPLTKLAVAGNVGIGVSFGTAAAPVNGLAVEGNVGVGTTSPIQALHVVGQCVAKGTRIRRRRKNTSDGGRGEDEDSSEVDWEEVAVEDIKPDDEVLSLNDKQSLRPDGLKTGDWEWHKVEKTMDMGLQEVFRLETQSGKWIETTANHPYLVLENGILATKKSARADFGDPTKVGSDLAYHLFESVSQTTTDVKSESQSVEVAGFAPAGPWVINQIPHSGTPTLLSSISQGVWVKVKHLKPGMIIATVDDWEKVVSLRSKGRKQTYDLQIEGTHNFVGGHYINTRTGTALSEKDEEIIYQLLSVDSLPENYEDHDKGNDKQEIDHFSFEQKLINSINHNSNLFSKLIAKYRYIIERNNLYVNSKPLGEVGITKNQAADGEIINFINQSLKEKGATVKAEDLPYIEYGGIVAHNTYISGNLGIGFTTPDRKIQVASDINIVGSNASLLGAAGTQFSLTGDSASGTQKKLVLGIDTTDNYGVIQAGNTSGTNYDLSLNPAGGNVGVGTTSPIQALHVVGQCVTGDSELITEDGKKIRVDEVKEGQKVYTLDQKTGKLVPAQINALLDMGVKPVFKLTTKSGKQIRTTGNHPYLVKAELTGFGSHLQDNNSQKDGNQNSSGPNLNVGVNLPQTGKFVHKFNPSSSLTVDNKNNIPNNRSAVNTAASPQVLGDEKFGTVAAAASQNADKLIQSPDSALFQAFDSLTYSTVPEEDQYVNSVGGVWTKVMYLKKGMEIAVADTSDGGPKGLLRGGEMVWDEIVSIEYTGEEQVWDLSIEGTHNFVANGIIAHNTYISGNLGIGFTTPDRKIQVASDINIVGSNASLLGAAGTQFSITGDSASGTQKKLVLGIDTTDNYGVIQAGNTSGTNYDLSLNPAGGNVGIGTASPGALLSLGTSLSTKKLYLYDAANPYGFGVTSNLLSVYVGADDANNRIGFGKYDGTTFTEWTSIRNGNVGIGTTGPRGPLDVVGSVGGVATFQTTSTTTGNWLTFTGGTGAGTLKGYMGFAGQTAGSAELLTGELTDALVLRSQNAIQFGTNGANARMTIAAGGNVGIGFSSPASRLDIRGGWLSLGLGQAFTWNSSQGSVYLATGYAGALNTEIADGRMAFYTAPSSSGAVTFTERLTIANGGNVGIGTASPGEKLQVAGSVKVTGAATTNLASSGQMEYSNEVYRFLSNGPNTSTNGTFEIKSQRSDGTNGLTVFISDTSAGVQFPNISTTASAANAFLDNASSPANNLLRSTSSLRYKTDLQDITLDQARNIALGRHAFSYTSLSKADNPDTRWIGYAAEEIAPVDKRFVTFDASGAPNWVQYERFIVPHGLILDDHEKRVSTLETQVASQSAALSALKNAITVSPTGNGSTSLTTSVGIGNTAPGQLLHVGQCVAVGTRIRRRRRKATGNRQQDDEWLEIITESGRILEVTKDQLLLGCSFIESNVDQNQRNYTQEEGNQSSGIGIQDISLFRFHKELLNANAINKDNITPTISPVNTTHFFNPVSFEKLGTITIAANQPAARLINTSAITDLNTGLIASTSSTLSDDIMAVKQIKAADLLVGDYLIFDEVLEKIVKINRIIDSWLEEEVPVEDIRPGDEVLSLNDTTGEWEWHKVEKTMDMGIQEVFRLETESGKWIETTANHPYLMLEEGNIGQKPGNQNQTKSYGSFDVDIFNVNFSINSFSNHSPMDFLSANAITKLIIPNPILTVNNQGLSLGLLAPHGINIDAANQPAEILISKSDNVITNVLSTSDSISQAKWIKVSQLKIGQYIATLNGWEKIKSINKVGRVQTYDLQIANTHNFVGNDIVAHNTFVVSSGGNVGIGTTTPSARLQVTGDSGQLLTLSTPTANVFSIDSLGNMKLAGTITSSAGAFDIAEDYPVSDTNIEAGDVVSIQSSVLGSQLSDSGSSVISSSEADKQTTEKLTSENRQQKTDNSGKLIKSSTPYDTKLIGIISTKPEVNLASSRHSGLPRIDSGVADAPQNDNMRPVALAGRVPVKVSTENGPIEVGDFLTSSSTPGVAMKATRPGEVVGKALESYSNPDPHQWGKILAFVNVTWADPGNFLSSLSFDNEGNLIVPKIKVGSLALDPSLATASAQLSVNSYQLTTNSDPKYINPGPQLATNSNTAVDLNGKLASLDETIVKQQKKIDSLEEKLAQLENQLQKGTPFEATGSAISSDTLAEATSSATPSASLASNCTLYPVPCTLHLTPPDILIASGSAALATNTSKVISGSFEVNEATVSGMLTAYKAQIQDNFKVFGSSTFGKTSIAGDLFVDGSLSVEKGSEINVIGTLFLQKFSLAQKLDIFNGTVTIDSSGNIKTSGEVAGASVVTNKLTISNTPIASSSASLTPTIGTGKILAGQLSITIPTTQASSTAKIFVTPRAKIGTQALVVDSVTDKKEFKVSLDHPLPDDLTFDWWIVGTN